MTQMVLSIVLINIDLKFIFLSSPFIKLLLFRLNLVVTAWVSRIHLLIYHLIPQVVFIRVFTDVAQDIIFPQMWNLAWFLYLLVMVLGIFINVVAGILVGGCPTCSTLGLVALWGNCLGLYAQRLFLNWSKRGLNSLFCRIHWRVTLFALGKFLLHNPEVGLCLFLMEFLYKLPVWIGKLSCDLFGNFF